LKTYILKPRREHHSLSRYNAKNNQRKAVDVLTGISLGILADGNICSKESAFLATWLEYNAEELPSIYMQKLRPFLEQASASKEVDKLVREEFVNVLMDIIGHEPSPPEEAAPITAGRVGKPTNIIFDGLPATEISFENNEFCLSGEFVHGSRRLMKKTITDLGGINSPSIPRIATNYLVVGMKGSDQWSNSVLGNKIEQALKMKEKGYEILIITEQVFIEATTLPQG